MEIRALAEYIVKTLVDYPDRVVVEEKKGAFASVLEIRVHEADIGIVIGKKVGPSPPCKRPDVPRSVG